jgi:hypothetical protein
MIVFIDILIRDPTKEIFFNNRLFSTPGKMKVMVGAEGISMVFYATSPDHQIILLKAECLSQKPMVCRVSLHADAFVFCKFRYDGPLKTNFWYVCPNEVTRNEIEGQNPVYRGENYEALTAGA